MKFFHALLPLQMNQLRKRELDEMFHPIFFGYSSYRDSARGICCFRTMNVFDSMQRQILIVMQEQISKLTVCVTQVVLEHCLNQNVLDQNDYDKMTIQLVCSHYYHTEFGTETLMEALKQANWNLAEPYNSLVQAFGEQGMSLQKALNMAVDFLFKIWEEPNTLQPVKNCNVRFIGWAYIRTRYSRSPEPT